MDYDLVRQLAGPLRAESFVKFCQLAVERSLWSIVETGCYRGIDADGQSTEILAHLAKAVEGGFHSCDLNPDHVALAVARLRERGLGGRVAAKDSLTFLREQPWPHAVYLDSYDYEFDNPLPAQMHMLAEVGAVIGGMPSDGILLLDDCNIEGGGKGLLADRFLKLRGWKLLHDGYQKLYSR